MAFMMPVVKNDWDIYKSQRTSSSNSRRTSESSRKTSECMSRSECPSLSTSPGSADFFSPAHRSHPVAMRTSSRASLQSPSKASSSTASTSSSPPKAVGSQSSLNKFHSRLVDRLKRSFHRSASETSTRSSS